MKLKTTAILCSVLFVIASCKNAPKEEETPAEVPQTEVSEEEPAQKFKNKGHELVYNLVEKVGSYKKLRSKKDVVYTYTYATPDGKADISTEKYIFNGELSYGAYKQHERTLPNLKGTLEQGYDGKEYWIKLEGEELKDSALIKRVMFTRPTNFYWFAMYQKLLDPGLTYEYLGEKELDSTAFEVVKISFDLNNNKPSDIYQIYINKETGLVDQFLFTVADFGIVEEPFLMQMEYEEIEGLLIPTKRKYKKSTWEAAVTDAPWVDVTWADISFNNGLTTEDFTK